MSLIYGYSKDDSGGGGGGAVASLKSLVGSKTDSTSDDTAFGKIQKNKEDIVSSAASVVASTSKVIASVVSNVGQKTDDKTKDTAFGRIKTNKADILSLNNGQVKTNKETIGNLAALVQSNKIAIEYLAAGSY